MSIYNDHTYRKKRAALMRKCKRDGIPCWYCGEPFDWTLDWRLPGGFTADHVDPMSKGGKLLGELKPAHRGCNSRRGNGDNQKKSREPLKTSIEW